MQVDDGGEVEEPAVAVWQVGDVTDVPLVDRVGGEVPADQIRRLRCSRVRDGGAVPPAQPQALQADGPHHPGHALVVDAFPGVAKFVGDPGDAVAPSGLDEPRTADDAPDRHLAMEGSRITPSIRAIWKATWNKSAARRGARVLVVV